MGSETLLKPACELSYAIARDGVEGEPPVDPPDVMRSFLYVGELPGRALSLAQQAIEDDPAFRRRVADKATEDDVGRAGYLWLHRPIGWAAEFERLSNGGPEVAVVESVPAIEAEPDRAMVGVPASPFDTTGEIVLDRPPSMLSDRAGERSEANAIEDELASLRGLVDRLSHERRAVSGSVRRVEQELESARHQPSVFDSDIYTLQSELSAARTELEIARQERDTAVGQHSVALTRQLELEKELARSRELRAEIESEHAEIDAATVEVRESLARAEASLAAVEEQRADMAGQLAALGTDNEDLSAQLSRVADEKTAQTRALEADYKALQAETETLRADKDTLADKLAVVEVDLRDVKAKLGQTEVQATEARSLVEALTEEKIDLASRLADTEAMLETTRTQLVAVRSDTEAVLADLANIRAHRDGLSAQVDDLHKSLTEALNDLASVRSVSDSDRAALKEVRAERDALRIRIGTLEQIEEGLEAKLATVTAERDAYSGRIDQTKSDLAERESAFNELMAENDRLLNELTSTREARDGVVTERRELQSELDAVMARGAELEEERSGLQQQVAQLTDENSGIQAQLVESDRMRAEAADNQGKALSELAQRLSLVENDRNRLERELRAAEDRLIEAMAAFDAANKKAAEQARLKLGGDAVARAGAPLAGGRRKDPAAPVELASRRLGAETADIARPVGDGSDEPDRDEPEPEPVPGLIFGHAEPEPPRPAELSIFAPVSETVPPPPAPELSEDERDVVEIRSAKRSVWGFGSRLRGDSEVKPPGGAGEAGRKSEPITGEVEHLAEELEAEMAGSEAKLDLVGGEPVVEDDIDSISSQLAEAIESSEVAGGESELDLDEISELISRTVTDFDPVTLPSPDFESGPALRMDPDDEPKRRNRRSKRLFAGRTPEEEWEAEGGKTHEPTDPGAAARAAGVPPPSVFATGEEAAPPPASSAVSRPVDAVPMVAVPSDEAGSEGLSVDAGPRSRSGRRQIEIPDELVDDEVELARHVVSSPDVVLLVDGDSVAKMGWPSLPVPQQRDALVSYLADLSATCGAAPDVVFDGRIGEEESLPASRAVRIRLSTPPTEPTAALDELVDAYPEQWPIAVVTDDEELARSAVERGAAVLNNGQLLDLFIAQ
jgi:predicted  nucleic acid-binding Zn-ribbon protein